MDEAELTQQVQILHARISATDDRVSDLTVRVDELESPPEERAPESEE